MMRSQVRYLGRALKPPEALGFEGTATVLNTLLLESGSDFILFSRRKSSPSYCTLHDLSHLVCS
jgi:hypothetical protein